MRAYTRERSCTFTSQSPLGAHSGCFLLLSSLQIIHRNQRMWLLSEVSRARARASALTASRFGIRVNAIPRRGRRVRTYMIGIRIKHTHMQTVARMRRINAAHILILADTYAHINVVRSRAHGCR